MPDTHPQVVLVSIRLLAALVDYSTSRELPRAVRGVRCKGGPTAGRVVRGASRERIETSATFRGLDTRLTSFRCYSTTSWCDYLRAAISAARNALAGVPPIDQFSGATSTICPRTCFRSTPSTSTTTSVSALANS